MIDEKSFFKLSYGLYIVSSKAGEKAGGCVVNTLAQVTAVPEKLAVTVSKDNYTTELIQASGYFTGTVLTEATDMNTIAAFGFRSGKDIDKFDGFSAQTDVNGVPYLTDTMAAVYSCKVVGQLDLGTHIMFIGEVTEAKTLNDAPVMTYDYYHRIKKGTTPKNAPSYKKTVEVSGKKAFRCKVCGYVVEAESLPDDFVCPICHQGRDAFEEIN